MRDRMNEIGGQLLWLLGHTLFTVITVCAARGGYLFFQDYKELTKGQKEQYVAKLDMETDEDAENLARVLAAQGRSR